MIMQSFSKNLLGLKFMQRAQKEAEKKDDEDDSDETFNAKLKNKQKCIVNPSYQFCERLRFGRFSFKGMNPDVESLMYKNDPRSTQSTNNSGEKRSAVDTEGSIDEDEDA